MDEAAYLCPSFAGVSYERLEGLEQPSMASEKETELIRRYYIQTNLPSRMAKPVCFQWTGQNHYIAGKEFDLHLNNGRLLEHFHEGNMTYRSEGLTHKVPHPWLESIAGIGAGTRS